MVTTRSYFKPMTLESLEAQLLDRIYGFAVEVVRNIYGSSEGLPHE